MWTIHRLCKTRRNARPIRKFGRHAHARRWQRRRGLTVRILNPNDAKGFRENCLAAVLYSETLLGIPCLGRPTPLGAAVVSEAV
jgi:hypothetical protein